jgi:hypothetical protein
MLILSNNKLSDQDLLDFHLSDSLKVLKMSNCSLSSFRYIERLLNSNNVYLKYLVINSNNLNFLESINNVEEISHLDISDNDFGFLFSDNVVITEFSERYESLSFINMTKSMSKKISDKIIEFNNQLEYAYLSSNHLRSFPTFCKYLNLECQLKVLDFKSNNLYRIENQNIMHLENIEYLDLANNRIEFIEKVHLIT